MAQARCYSALLIMSLTVFFLVASLPTWSFAFSDGEAVRILPSDNSQTSQTNDAKERSGTNTSTTPGESVEIGTEVGVEDNTNTTVDADQHAENTENKAESKQANSDDSITSPSSDSITINLTPLDIKACKKITFLENSPRYQACLEERLAMHRCQLTNQRQYDALNQDPIKICQDEADNRFSDALIQELRLAYLFKAPSDDHFQYIVVKDQPAYQAAQLADLKDTFVSMCTNRYIELLDSLPDLQEICNHKLNYSR